MRRAAVTWKALILTLTAMIVVTALAGLRWVCSDGDLDAIDALAARDGLVLERHHADRLYAGAAWRAAGMRVRELASPDTGSFRWPQPGEAPTDALDPLRAPADTAATRTVVDEMLGLLAAGATGPSDLGIAEDLSLRLLVASPDDLRGLATVATRCAGGEVPLRHVVRAIAYRLGDCRRAHVDGDGLMRSADASLAEFDVRDDAMDAFLYYRTRDPWSWKALGRRIEDRWARASQAAFWLDWIMFTRSSPSLPAVIARVRSLPAEGRWWDRARDAAANAREDLVERLTRDVQPALHARALAALLDRTPLPIDGCDPAGGTMRCRSVGGRISSVWSVGLDGTDDGGDPAKDWVLAIDSVDPDAGE